MCTLQSKDKRRGRNRHRIRRGRRDRRRTPRMERLEYRRLLAADPIWSALVMDQPVSDVAQATGSDWPSWRSEELVDEGAGTHDGTLATSNDIESSPLGVDQALQFDGADVVTIPDTPSLNPSLITVETRVNFDRLAYGPGMSGTDYQMLVCKGSDGARGNYRLRQSGSSEGNYSLSFGVGSFWEKWEAYGSAQLETNRWYHVAGTYDGESLGVYLDGVLLGSKVVGDVDFGNSEPVYLSYNDVSTFPYHLTGQMDDVRIWDRALSAEEIRTNMHASLAGTETGLAAFFDFDDPIGSQAIADRTPNANNGYLGQATSPDSRDPARVPLDLPPTVVDSVPSSGSTVGSSFDLDVTFSEPVLGVDATDLVLDGPAATDATVGDLVDLGGNTWRFPVADLRSGSLAVTLAPNPGSIEDLAGNDLAQVVWDLVVEVEPSLTLDVDHFVLLPNTPNQTIPIHITGGARIQGSLLNVQISDGFSDVPGSSMDGPNITGVDLVSPGTIFGSVANNGNNVIESREQIWVVGASTSDGTIVADGVLAYVTIDTTGWFGGDRTWELKLSDTFNGNTNFQTPDGQLTPDITNGSIRIDRLPVADPGGPYTVLEGGQVVLDASGSADSDPGDSIVEYQWDLDGDGVYGETGESAAYGDELGVSPMFSAAGLDGPDTLTASLKVTDSFGATSEPQTASISIDNVAPVADPVTQQTIHRVRALALQDLPVVFTDAGTLDSHIAVIDWGDGTPADNGAIVEPTADNPGEVHADHRYAAGGEYMVTITLEDDDGGQDAINFTVTVLDSVVAQRHVFYNNSAFDGDDTAANAADDGAIAPQEPAADTDDVTSPDRQPKQLGKRALLPGETASFVNYTSYSQGLNGIMIDVTNLPGTPSVDDFRFMVGNINDPATWTMAPTPQSITVRPEAGVDGADRVTIIWADESPYTPEREAGAISNQWLQVTMLPTEYTGVPQADVFYFGNAIGESGNSTIETNVDTNDEIGARNHSHSLFDPAMPEDAYDYDRDRRVDTNDEIIARNNSTSAFSRLQLIAVPAAQVEQTGQTYATVNAVIDSVSGDASKHSLVVVGDLLFEDSGMGDYRLQVDSPAMDPGVATRLGFPGPAPDRGALEFRPITDQTSPTDRDEHGLRNTALLAELSDEGWPADDEEVLSALASNVLDGWSEADPLDSLISDIVESLPQAIV
ncbi:MAG: hypothetical protein H8E44_25240 [Planctomycetes bacterium]|nr:hypothetical protein [Planctomycetota bacterium]MBL7044466.1 hypothetical protein [Pirellulaceae bacterium]